MFQNQESAPAPQTGQIVSETEEEQEECGFEEGK
jgi:hypothetical protein